MAAPDTLNSVTARKLSSVITSLWAKIKSTFQTLGNLVTSIRASSSASDDKYPSEKAVASAIAGKLDKDGSNSINNNDGTGTVATMLNNTEVGANDVTSDDMYIMTTDSAGTDDGKWYKRKISKLWSWITSHFQVSIFKPSADVYVRVGADYNHCLYLDYDSVSTSTPVMGLWARWGSGSDAKWMAQCDSSGNCTFNGTATGSLNKDGSNAESLTGGNIIRALNDWGTIADDEAIPAANVSSGATTQGRYSFLKVRNYMLGLGRGMSSTTDSGFFTTGLTYGDRVSINSGYVYGWRIGSMTSATGFANANFKALVVISDWTEMEDYHCNEFVGVLDIGARMNSETVSTNDWQLIGRLTSVLPQKTSGASNKRGWSVFCKTNSSTYKSEWYIGKNSASANMNIGFRFSKITLLPLFEYNWTRELVRETTGNMTFNSGKDDWWGQHLSPTISATTYSLGNAYNPIYINSDKRFQACTSVAKITDIGNAANGHINVKWKDSSVGSDFQYFACFRTGQSSPDGTTPSATLCDIPLPQARKRILQPTYGSAVGSENLPVYVDVDGNVKTIGKKLQIPAASGSDESYVRVGHGDYIRAYLDCDSSHAGMWCKGSNSDNGGWVVWRDTSGNNYFAGMANCANAIYDQNNGGWVKLSVGGIGSQSNTLYIVR